MKKKSRLPICFSCKNYRDFAVINSSKKYLIDCRLRWTAWVSGKVRQCCMYQGDFESEMKLILRQEAMNEDRRTESING